MIFDELFSQIAAETTPSEPPKAKPQIQGAEVRLNLEDVQRRRLSKVKTERLAKLMETDLGR
ncbi:hypothetical protein ACYOEI_00290 [Singulisphaera rosea]